jgi:Secretion system C-terminal sorting domain
MKYFLFSVLFLTSTIISYAQNEKSKLLFNIKGDLENPSFFLVNGYQGTNSILFEVHKDSASNIFMSDYSVDADSFLTPSPITNNNALNINPKGFDLNTGKIIFFETNLYGNWDIAYREFKNGEWGDIEVIDNPGSDESNISLVKGDQYGYLERRGIVYQCNNSIYLLQKDSVVHNILLLKSSDSLMFSNPSGIYTYNFLHGKFQDNLKIAVIERDKFNNNKIIEKIKSLETNYDTTIIIDYGNLKNPQFSRLNYSYMLTYEKIENGKSQIYYYDEYSNNNLLLNLNDTLNGNFSNFQSENNPPEVVTKRNSSNFLSPFPYLYNFNKNNINNLFVYQGFSYLKDILFLTEVNNPKTAIEYLDFYIGYNTVINYVIWEDSLNGNIKLFGYKFYTNNPGAVKEKNYENKFVLYQNYPNPFNPSTTIYYQILKDGPVKINIYDALGREVVTLLNVSQKEGEHEVVWNAKNFSSGIYFYQIRAGEFVSTKKMLLIK